MVELASEIRWQDRRFEVPLERILLTEKWGYDAVFTPEGFGAECLIPAGYLAGHVQHMTIGTRILQVTGRAPVKALEAFQGLNHLTGGGRIIAGLGAGYGFWDYRASKAAIANFSASIAIDLAEYDIRVNTIVPGHIRTEMASFAEAGMDAETADRLERALLPLWQANQPLKRQGRPIDVAHAAMFLGSDRSAYITGTTVTVDGGVNAGDPVNHIQKFMDARAEVLGV